MTHPNDPGRAHALDAEMVAELDELLPCVCDDVMTARDRQRLNQILDHNFAARRYYLELIAVHSALVTTAGNFTRPELANGTHDIKSLSIESFDEQPIPKSVAGRSLFSHPQDRRFRRSVLSWGPVAALVLIGFVVFWEYGRDGHQAQTIGSNVARVPTTVSVSPDVQSLVAKVTYLSSTVRWQDSNASYALDSRIGSGQNVALEHGQVELTYAMGAKLLLTGPSEFVVQSGGGKLRRGQLVARVSAEGHGFRIETPHGQVIDLGTEFGVVVDDFGVSQVSVFEGRVETLPIGVADPAQRIELTSGRALQLTGKAVIPMEAIGRRYQPAGEEDTEDKHGTSTATLERDFRRESLPSTIGKTIGTVKPTPLGLQFGGSTQADGKPYLITHQEFDPAQGAITVICDVRFVGTTDGSTGSFAILTRSADEQSKLGLPWQDVLARFLRCNFRVDPDSGEGMLEAGTKFEADRELTNNFWGGFSRPQPGTLYRLEMHDDGLNVTFTVSQVEKPSVRKTIHCRSLFRGNHNFVALEGSDTETTIVERLQILQERRSDLEGNQLIASESEHTLQLSNGATFPNQLETLIPTNATLLVKDDFDGQVLDSSVWSILGDTVLLDGQVQLGVTNAADHIDTWKQRPYLLTKLRFDPHDGALTIVGKVTFAENFLNGYGGSFAVMTRADDSHGIGPGWEYSILQRGVRSNFWPAALGIDHSLEIHEKPQPNTISLLTAEGFQINPRSRTYYFRVTDDGKTAMLTFVDATNTRIRKTISYPTGIDVPSAGHIAFESCWGSPVLLDNVRIFRSNRQPQEQTSVNE